MALKPYDELVKLDVLPFCDKRKAKDETGKEITVPYLNWAKCVELLHQNGAETVYYTPLRGPDGSYLFSSAQVETGKSARKTGCWFVSVEIHIDDLVFTMDAPLMNGSLVVYQDTLNQLRIANCHARAFVKGVAIRTGLGFHLWVSEKDTDAAPDDLGGHSIFAIKERVDRLITDRLQRGMSMEDIYAALGTNRRRFEVVMNSFSDIDYLERTLRAL